MVMKGKLTINTDVTQNPTQEDMPFHSNWIDLLSQGEGSLNLDNFPDCTYAESPAIMPSNDVLGSFSTMPPSKPPIPDQFDQEQQPVISPFTQYHSPTASYYSPTTASPNQSDFKQARKSLSLPTPLPSQLPSNQAIKRARLLPPRLIDIPVSNQPSHQQQLQRSNKATYRKSHRRTNSLDKTLQQDKMNFIFSPPPTTFTCHSATAASLNFPFSERNHHNNSAFQPSSFDCASPMMMTSVSTCSSMDSLSSFNQQYPQNPPDSPCTSTTSSVMYASSRMENLLPFSNGGEVTSSMENSMFPPFNPMFKNTMYEHPNPLPITQQPPSFLFDPSSQQLSSSLPSYPQDSRTLLVSPPITPEFGTAIKKEGKSKDANNGLLNVCIPNYMDMEQAPLVSLFTHQDLFKINPKDQVEKPRPKHPENESVQETVKMEEEVTQDDVDESTGYTSSSSFEEDSEKNIPESITPFIKEEASMEPVVKEKRKYVKKALTSAQLVNECDQKKWLHCPFGGCDRVFDKKFTLKSHLVVHAEQKFQCEHCGTKFKRSHDMMRHTRRRHPETLETQ